MVFGEALPLPPETLTLPGVDRPVRAASAPLSLAWRLAWLVFCLVTLCLFGARTFRRIVPYVLAGITERARPPVDSAPADGDSGLVTWVLPGVTWSLLIGLIIWLVIG